MAWCAPSLASHSTTLVCTARSEGGGATCHGGSGRSWRRGGGPWSFGGWRKPRSGTPSSRPASWRTRGRVHGHEDPRKSRALGVRGAILTPAAPAGTPVTAAPATPVTATTPTRRLVGRRRPLRRQVSVLPPSQLQPRQERVQMPHLHPSRLRVARPRRSSVRYLRCGGPHHRPPAPVVLPRRVRPSHHPSPSAE